LSKLRITNLLLKVTNERAKTLEVALSFAEESIDILPESGPLGATLYKGLLDMDHWEMGMLSVEALLAEESLIMILASGVNTNMLCMVLLAAGAKGGGYRVFPGLLALLSE
jgi:hypothetical protein